MYQAETNMVGLSRIYGSEARASSNIAGGEGGEAPPSRKAASHSIYYTHLQLLRLAYLETPASTHN